jgi:hypothetical protein
MEYNIYMVAYIAMSIFMAEDIVTIYIARHRYCTKYIGRNKTATTTNILLCVSLSYTPYEFFGELLGALQKCSTHT